MLYPKNKRRKRLGADLASVPFRGKFMTIIFLFFKELSTCYAVCTLGGNGEASGGIKHVSLGFCPKRFPRDVSSCPL